MREGEDFDETNMPTMAQASYFAQQAMALRHRSRNLPIIKEGWDVSGAYYRTYNRFKQWMRPAPGYENGTMVWRLVKCMPGSKDAGHNFSRQFATYLIEVVGMCQNPSDGSVFFMTKLELFICLSLHVDDGQSFSNSQSLTDQVYELINKKFPLKRRKGINLVTGIYSIDGVDSDGIPYTRFHQQPLLDEAVKLAGQEDGKATYTPMKSSWKMYGEHQLVQDKLKRKALDVFPYA